MGLQFIKDYVYQELNEFTSQQLANRLNISVAMLSSYKTQGYNPSISVAMIVYKLDNTVLHPFSEESLKFEIEKRK